MPKQKTEREALKDLAADFALRVGRGIAPPDGRHPLAGMFCHKVSTDSDLTKHGTFYERSGHIEAVVGEVAMMRTFSALDGEPMGIKPMPLDELLAGDWEFYDDYNHWRDVKAVALARYFRPLNPEHRAINDDRRVSRALGDTLRHPPNDEKPTP